MPGIVNTGLLATQELRDGPRCSDWGAASAHARGKLKLRGQALIKALGHNINQLSVNASLLTSGADRRAVAVFLDEGETFETPAARFEGVSPVSRVLAIVAREHLSWVILTPRLCSGVLHRALKSISYRSGREIVDV
jgi:hypothetical protein